MKLAHNVTLTQAVAAIQAADAALVRLQQVFTVSDQCEVEVVLMRQRLGKLDVAVSEAIQRADYRQSRKVLNQES